MNDIFCGYSGDREAALMAYLYDEIAPADRDAFKTHLAACARCRTELNALGGVRAQIARWAPPAFAGTEYRVGGEEAPVPDRPAARRPSWSTIPFWAQAAAAMLVLGASAGLANLDIRYDARNGVSVRTGWGRTAVPSPGAAVAAGDNAAAWREAMTRLEQRLRSEIRSAAPVAAPAVVRPASGDADVVRRVKALVDESERRQQREMALRMAELMRDLNAQRQADLRKIDQNLGLMQDRTGVEVLRTRQQVDYLLQRVSQRQ